MSRLFKNAVIGAFVGALIFFSCATVFLMLAFDKDILSPEKILSFSASVAWVGAFCGAFYQAIIKPGFSHPDSKKQGKGGSGNNETSGTTGGGYDSGSYGGGCGGGGGD
ncbi:hypothetical protein [Thalassotalea sp. PS06]|uniref:hypothetical protein n=1 Tax=Thalassotalea sp. PS06 TaxID=2594005 RepID=UPI001163146F|nr:hypothetical protein [Thalassotalea sp. PS06]QDP01527.1 hypothetical protein FNC98_09380 [Thalassotalea sp. PS06]